MCKQTRLFMMMYSVALGVLAATTLSVRPATAADPQQTIVVTIEGMHCQGCANKVVRQIKKVAGVHRVAVSAKTKKATVVATEKATPSPRSLWEAVERTGFKPIKLVCQFGTFTKKPLR